MKYGKTEQDVSAEKSSQCREIVREILNFGVNEFQKIRIIQLLSLELENRDLMLKITNIVKKDDETSKENVLIKID
ncbi:hypothetical protein CMI47_11515 [Candidatus Pacearchaeota archaeon]|nr:hypothetical protein [Candidatus Pacearchaeota archaeon]|tara:strand:- start:362 stop:589 length:228 start_codon:yes stop_codon:yes gene_type:complete